MSSLPPVRNSIVAQSQHNLGKMKSKSSSTWWSMEDNGRDSNSNMLIAVNAPIKQIVCVLAENLQAHLDLVKSTLYVIYIEIILDMPYFPSIITRFTCVMFCVQSLYN